MAKKPKINIYWNEKAFTYLLEVTTFIADYSGEDKANQFKQELFAFLKENFPNFLKDTLLVNSKS